VKLRTKRSLLAGALCVTLAVALGGAVTSSRAGSPGGEVTLGIVASPVPVSPGELVTFVITAQSNSTSNLSHFTVTGPATGSTPLAYVATSRPDICTAPTNPATTPATNGINCSFGAFASGSAPLPVALVFRVPANFGGSTINFVATASYSGGSNNDNSGRTNTVVGSASTTVETDQDLTKGFVVSSFGDTLSTVPVPDGDSPGNPQSVSASVNANSVPGFGVVGTVQDLPHSAGDTTTNCGPGFSCWGQSELVTFMSGNVDVSLVGTPGTLVVRTDDSEIPSGVNKRNIKWFHDGALLPSCSGLPAVPTNGCVSNVDKLTDNDLLTTILGFHYGFVRP
jgi:hypothetical protein